MKISCLSLGLVVGVAAVFSTISFAANSEGLDCGNEQTTVEIKICLSNELDAADGELNRVYKALRSDQDEAANELLKAAQRAWIAYRDTECTRVADVARGGTLAGVLELSCHVDFTKSRTNELAINPVTGEAKY